VCWYDVYVFALLSCKYFHGMYINSETEEF